jgi:hypothetical protein
MSEIHLDENWIRLLGLVATQKLNKSVSRYRNIDRSKGNQFPNDAYKALIQMMQTAPYRMVRGSLLTYPTPEAVKAVSQKFNLTETQVKNFASNYRRRVQSKRKLT